MNLDPKKTIFLIDGSSFLYRAYYGTRPLHTSFGEPVNAVYSFCRMIKNLIDRFSIEQVALVWDSKGPTVRHEIFTDYKATRQAPPSDLFDQKERIIKFAELIGLHQISLQGYEADDLMYAVARDYAGKGYTVVLVTSDKDMGQAVNEHVLMYDFFKDQLLTADRVAEKFGFAPAKIPFYFALLGDSSDNIPGVRGIGEKSAQELVTQFDSLEDLYARIDTITKPRIKNALLENKDNAFLSRELFLLRYVVTGTTLENLAFKTTNWVKAFPLFKELEFKSLLTDDGITKEQRQEIAQQKITELKNRDFRTITTREQLENIAAEIRSAGFVALDTETTGVSPFTNCMVGLSLCTNESVAYYLPFAHVTQESQLDFATIATILGPIFRDQKIRKLFHHAKFDLHVLASAGLEVDGPIFDTFIAASLVTKEWQRVGLKQLAEFYFNEQMLTFQEMVTAHKLPNFAHVDLAAATLYAANDAFQTFKLAKVFAKELVDQEMRDLFKDLEMPLMRVLYGMEKRGILVDRALFEKMDKELAAALTQIEADINAMLPAREEPINLNSPKQLEQLLFYELKLPPQKKSGKKTGYSTDQEVLELLSEMHPIPRLILKYRELYKLQSTYVQGLQPFILESDNRIHTTYSQTRVATGRLSSLDPNLQNIPAVGPGLMVRQAFIPAPGNLFISADYSQIELRVLAYLSKDPALTQAFLDGRDIHREIAAHLFGVSFDAVTHEQRQVGKRINFSILYGLTPYGLSKDLDIPFGQAKEYIDKYFAQYPKVQEWMERVVNETIEKGYVTTLGGRRRYIPAIYEKNRVLFDEAKRVAINTVAQGTAAEIMKKGMLALQALFDAQKLSGAMVLQIHDELLLEVPAAHAEKAQEIIKNTLETVVDWPVPLVVMTRTGTDWKEVSK